MKNFWLWIGYAVGLTVLILCHVIAALIERCRKRRRRDTNVSLAYKVTTRIDEDGARVIDKADLVEISLMPSDAKKGSNYSK